MISIVVLLESIQKIGWWSILFISLILLPIFLLYFIQYRTEKIKEITLTFSAPDGSLRTAQVKTGVSLPVLFFGEWALLFRGQFLEFFIVIFFVGSLVGGSVNVATNLVKDIHNVGNWILLIFLSLSALSIYYYFVIFGNKLRLKKLYQKGYLFDNEYNENVDDIYEYIGVQKRLSAKELESDQKQGTRHRFVVPENQQVKEDDPNDWTHLTTQDLKLLLKSEQIHFDPQMTKEELLELCDEYLRVEVEEKPKEDEFSKMTIGQLMDELEKKNISYKNNMTKEELRELLIKNK